MLFNSYIFFLFLCICFALYYSPLLRKRQTELLVVASFIFYAYAFPLLLILLLFSITINAAASYKIFFGRAEKRKLYATLGVVVNLGVLSFFKYSPLFSSLFYDPFSSIGMFLLSIPLPIGISFFTFHGISQLVDIYKGKNIDKYNHLIKGSFSKTWLVTSLYIAFFPQLVAGPIVKAHSFLPQIKQKFFKDINWELAVRQLILGYFLKMVIADNLKDQTFWIGYASFVERESSITLIVMLLGYSMQIFADFAGYSLIALGLAELFGYKLPVNFNFPYISRSFSEFWERWHISLSSWLREYLYFSLGGNRKGNLRTYFNLMAVMFLGGLWHGAAWSYAVWGSFHGLALVVERLVANNTRIKDNLLLKVLRTLMVFSFVTLAWLLFKLPDFSEAMHYVQAIFHNIHAANMSIPLIFFILLYSFPVVAFHLYHLFWEQTGRSGRFSLKAVVYALLLFCIIVNSGSAGEFIYFQF